MPVPVTWKATHHMTMCAIGNFAALSWSHCFYFMTAMSRKPHSSRRQLLQISAVATLLPLMGMARAQSALPQVEVWKDASCGCCKDWIAHMEKNGFRVRAHETGNNAIRARLGLAQQYASCHTALVGGYVIEGHVPASDVKRLLGERPRALGLAVPGMPIGSPGMDGPVYGGRRDPYAVLLVQRDGSSRVFKRYA